MKFKYEISGTGKTAGSGIAQTFETTGTVEATALLPGAMELSMRDSFRQLTNGKAVFGKPGVGCNGPYHITRLLIEEAME